MPSDRLLTANLTASAGGKLSSGPNDTAPPSKRIGVDFQEQSNGAILAVGGVLITGALAVAVWATLSYGKSTKPHASDPAADVLVERVTITAPEQSRRTGPTRPAAPLTDALANRDKPTLGVVGGNPVPRVASDYLDWGALSLLVRTGYTDDEVIQVASGKQLAVYIGPEQERLLRGMGAGDRLVRYLRGLPVHRVALAPGNPTPAQSRQVDAPVPFKADPTASAYVAPTAIPVDYVARDRQISTLKKRLDGLDEDMRVLRTQPQNYRFRYEFQWNGNRVDQLSYNAYMKRLDEQRDELRREIWQLEGR